MAKPQYIELGDGTVISILYEDRAVMAIDKPAGWLLAPDSWDRTSRNLQLALRSSMNAGDHWARSRNLRYVRFVHRLDADTGGVLLLAKSSGALTAYSRLFESRSVQKIYLAVVEGIPNRAQWICNLKLAPHPNATGQMQVDERHGKEAETSFRLLQTANGAALIEAQPTTGRTHQIRVHLAATGHPVVDDRLYNAKAVRTRRDHLGLRAFKLTFPDPFQKRAVRIEAPVAQFVREYGFTWNTGGSLGADRFNREAS